MPVKKKIHSESSVKALSLVEDIVGEKPASTSTSNVAEANVAAANPAPVVSQTFEESPRYEPRTVPTQEVSGILDIQPEGHGFLRPKFIPSQRDIYISQSQIRRFMLRPGDWVEGIGRPPKDTERYFGLLKVEKVNKVAADDSLRRPYFDDLTPIYPKKQVTLTTGQKPLSTRIIDLIAPIGF